MASVANSHKICTIWLIFNEIVKLLAEKNETNDKANCKFPFQPWLLQSVFDQERHVYIRVPQSLAKLPVSDLTIRL